MKIGSEDIISKSTLRSASQLSITGSVVLVAVLWKQDFATLSIAGVQVLDSEAFYWIAFATLCVQLVGHAVSWFDDFLSYRQFRNLAKDVGKRLDDLTHHRDETNPDSELGHAVGPMLEDRLKELDTILQKVAAFQSEKAKAQQDGTHDLTRECQVLSESLPSLDDRVRGLSYPPKFGH